MEEAVKAYDLCGHVVGAAMKVHSGLGAGFLESVYQNALIWELRKGGFKAEAERPISVHHISPAEGGRNFPLISGIQFVNFVHSVGK